MLCFMVAYGLSILKVVVLFGNTSINPIDKHLKQGLREFLQKFFVLGFRSLEAEQYLWMTVLLSIVVWVNDSQKHQSVIKQCKILVRYPISFINHDTKYYCRNAGLTNFSWPILPHQIRQTLVPQLCICDFWVVEAWYVNQIYVKLFYVLNIDFCCIRINIFPGFESFWRKSSQLSKLAQKGRLALTHFCNDDDIFDLIFFLLPDNGLRKMLDEQESGEKAAQNGLLSLFHLTFQFRSVFIFFQIFCNLLFGLVTEIQFTMSGFHERLDVNLFT